MQNQKQLWQQQQQKQPGHFGRDGKQN